MIHNLEKFRTYAAEAIKTEVDSLNRFFAEMDDSLAEAIAFLSSCKGRIIVTGIGKSAIVAQKMVATLNSTGSSASFLHAADALHGDLGVVSNDDMVICISKSGNTAELKQIFPHLRKKSKGIVSIVADMNSYLAQYSDYVVYTPIYKEACQHNLAPTASTTIQMVVCDAIAISLSRYKGFSEDEFRSIHPAGAIGEYLNSKL